jgi:plasmid stabilization system protein ParE
VTPVHFSDPAAAELIAAVQWYEQRRVGLGAELFDAVAATIELIQAHPEIGAERRGRRPSRQFNVHRFPYNVVYRIRDDDIYVVAVAHSSRRPGYWRRR